MATPRENTEVWRMLRDFKAAVSGCNYKSRTNLPSGQRMVDYSLDASKIVKELDFSNVSTSSLPSFSANETRHSSEALKRKLKAQEMELLTSQAALKAKECAYNSMDIAKKKVCLGLNQELEEVNKMNDALKQRVNELTTELKFSQKEVAFLRSSCIDIEIKISADLKKMEKDLLTSHEECSNLKYELAEAQSEKAGIVTKSNAEIGRLELMLMNTNEEVDASNGAVSSMKRQLQEITAKVELTDELKKQLDERDYQIKDLREQINRTEEGTLLVESMQTELKTLPKLKRENSILREELAKYKDNNVSLFQEKMWAYQEKLSQAEKRNGELAVLKVENDSLKSKLSDWEGLCNEKSFQGARSPMTFSRKLSNYQKNELLLTSKMSELSNHCKNLERKNAVLEAEVAQSKANCESVMKEATSVDPLVRRLKKRIFLVSRERDNCRQLIDSYVSEATVSTSLLNMTHIKSLENTIADYKKALESSEKEVDTLQEKAKDLSNSLSEKSGEIETLNKEKKQLLSSLNEHKSSMSTDAENVISREKVIHLKCNPLEEATRERNRKYKEILEENDRLKKRVSILEEEGALSADVTAKVQHRLENEGSDTLLQELRDRLTASERRQKLILDTAVIKSKEFREGVYSLTGYRVDMQPEGKYRLSHVYAEAPSDYLIFQIDGERVNVLETSYSQQVSELMSTYLHTYDSVPAFLASVTMHLFKQQTFMNQSNSSLASSVCI